jgi:hypothetical protein
MKALTLSSLLKVVILVVATWFGFVGILSLCMAFKLAAELLLGSVEIVFAMFFAPILLLIGSYFVWFCWLCWFHFSKRAVLHFCGMVAFFLLGAPGNFLGSASEPIGALVTLVWLFVVLAFYPKVAAALSRRIFVERNEATAVAM